MKRSSLPRHIFVTGLFRSGTTLLSRALSSHQLMHICYQPLTSLFISAQQKFWKEHHYPSAKPLGDSLLYETYWAEFLKTIPSLAYSPDELEILKMRLREDQKIDYQEKDSFFTEHIDRLSGSTFLEILESAYIEINTDLSQKGKTMAGIKEIWCEDFIPLFLHAGKKCIHIVRDPRGIIASRNYGNYIAKSCGGQKYPVLFIARAWRRSVGIYQHLANEQYYYFLRFEDMLCNPEKEFRKICQFLEVDFYQGMTDINNFRAGNGFQWRGNVDSDTFHAIDQSRAQAWKQSLSEDDMFLCEFLCAEEMKKLGYELTTDSEDTQRFMDLTEDPNAARSWLAEHNHILTFTEKKRELVRKGESFES